LLNILKGRYCRSAKESCPVSTDSAESYKSATDWALNRSTADLKYYILIWPDSVLAFLPPRLSEHIVHIGFQCRLLGPVIFVLFPQIHFAPVMRLLRACERDRFQTFEAVVGAQKEGFPELRQSAISCQHAFGNTALTSISGDATNSDNSEITRGSWPRNGMP
jgi:hypothetical protein